MSATASMTSNAEIVRRLMDEVWGEGRLDLLSELIALDYVGHLPIGDHYGPESVRIDIAAYRSAFPDLTVRIDDLFAAGDRVVRRYTLRGTDLRPAAGAGVIELHAIAIDRLAGGLLAESWVQSDPIPSAGNPNRPP